MSYWCHATKETVIGEPCTMVPTKIRKVLYIAQTKPDNKSNYLQFASQSEGWEIVEEVPVRRSSAEIFAQLYPPVIVDKVKEVFFMLPNKVEKIYRSRDDEDDIKPEM